jgi:hypothetical protein
MPWKEKILSCVIVENLSHLSKEDFYRTMVNREFFFLGDHKGLMPMDPTFLPETFGDMQGDPYRDLAAYVRVNKGFRATSVLYAEFFWANFFRCVARERLRD